MWDDGDDDYIALDSKLSKIGGAKRGQRLHENKHHAARDLWKHAKQGVQDESNPNSITNYVLNGVMRADESLPVSTFKDGEMPRNALVLSFNEYAEPDTQPLPTNLMQLQMAGLSNMSHIPVDFRTSSTTITSGLDDLMRMNKAYRWRTSECGDTMAKVLPFDPKRNGSSMYMKRAALKNFEQVSGGCGSEPVNKVEMVGPNGMPLPSSDMGPTGRKEDTPISDHYNYKPRDDQRDPVLVREKDEYQHEHNNEDNPKNPNNPQERTEDDIIKENPGLFNTMTNGLTSIIEGIIGNPKKTAATAAAIAATFLFMQSGGSMAGLRRHSRLVLDGLALWFNVLTGRQRDEVISAVEREGPPGAADAFSALIRASDDLVYESIARSANLRRSTDYLLRNMQDRQMREDGGGSELDFDEEVGDAGGDDSDGGGSELDFDGEGGDGGAYSRRPEDVRMRQSDPPRRGEAKYPPPEDDNADDDNGDDMAEIVDIYSSEPDEIDTELPGVMNRLDRILSADPQSAAPDNSFSTPPRPPQTQQKRRNPRFPDNSSPSMTRSQYVQEERQRRQASADRVKARQREMSADRVAAKKVREEQMARMRQADAEQRLRRRSARKKKRDEL